MQAAKRPASAHVPAGGSHGTADDIILPPCLLSTSAHGDCWVHGCVAELCVRHLHLTSLILSICCRYAASRSEGSGAVAYHVCFSTTTQVGRLQCYHARGLLS